MTQMVSRYPLSEFVVADIKPFSADMATACGAYEAVLVNTNAGRGRLSQMGTGYFDAVIECSGTQSGLDLAVDMCGMAGHIYLFGWHRTPRTLDFKLGHLRGQTLVHTSPATDAGRCYERYWPITIEMFKNGIFDMSKLVTHKYRAEDIQICMDDSVARPDGFIKSAFYL